MPWWIWALIIAVSVLFGGLIGAAAMLLYVGQAFRL